MNLVMLPPFFWFEALPGSATGPNFPYVPEQLCCRYALIAQQQHSPVSRKFYPAENGLSSRWLTSVIEIELVFPSE